MSRSFNYTSSVRDVVRRRSAGKCEWCGLPFRFLHTGLTDATIHHRHKREFGGRDCVSNLLNLHGSCHRALHRDEEWAAQFGLILWSDESSWKPVWVPSEEGRNVWVILSEEGETNLIENALAADLLGDCSRPERLAKNYPPKTLRRAS